MEIIYKKSHLKKFFFLVLISGLFLVYKPINAKTTEQTFNVNLATIKWTDSSKYTPQQYTFLTGQCLSSITMLYARNQWPGGIVIATTSVSATTLWTGRASSTYYASSSLQYVTFSPTGTESNICVTAGLNNRYITPQNVNFFVATPSSTYSAAGGWDKMGYSSNSYTLGTEQIYDIWINFNGFAADGTSIEFSSTPTSTCNFSNWHVNRFWGTTETNACLESGTCSVGVAFNIGGGDTTYPYNTLSGGYEAWSQVGYIPNSFTFTSGTVYNARAFLCSKNDQFDCWLSDNNDNIIAKSNNWQFIINGLDTCTTTYFDQGTIPTPVTSTEVGSIIDMATNQCQSFNDSSISGGVAYAFCRILTSLFVPSSDVLNKFVNLKDDLANKPPFGYITAYSEVWNNFTAQTTPSSTISTTEIYSLENVSLWEDFKTFLEYVIYLITAIIIWKRLSGLSLAG